jgi:hypothetical protein
MFESPTDSNLNKIYLNSSLTTTLSKTSQDDICSGKWRKHVRILQRDVVNDNELVIFVGSNFSWFNLKSNKF